jgi:TPR repeat protein
MLDRDRLAKILALLGSSEAGEILSAGRAADALIRNANTSWVEVLNQSASRALLAENERLWAIAQQLLVENDALRKRVARRLAHRILDDAKQFRRALLAFATAGIEFLHRQLAAYRHNCDSRKIRSVVIRSLPAAGILLTLSIVAMLSPDDFTTLGELYIRSRTVAPSAQEALEAARSGGLPPQAEQRSAIFNPPPITAMATSELTPTDTALAPVEDLTTVRASLPPAIAPGETAPAPDAPSPVASSPAPTEKQVTPPTTSRTTSPPATQSLPNQQLSAEIAALVARGDAFLRTGDIVSARLFYERAADRGDRSAALRLRETFDHGFLSWTGVRGAPGDPTQASSWYRRALDLGNPAVQERLRDLEQQRVAAPGLPPH